MERQIDDSTEKERKVREEGVIKKKKIESNRPTKKDRKG